MPKFVARDYMVMATRRGEVKKTSLDEFAVVRSLGLIAMDLEPGDELIGARLVGADDQVLLVTERGQAIRFEVQELRSASRTSGGVRGIRLDDNDNVVALCAVIHDAELLVVTTSGYGKRTPVAEYPTHGRGGGGIITARLTDKTGIAGLGAHPDRGGSRPDDHLGRGHRHPHRLAYGGAERPPHPGRALDEAARGR